MPTYIYGKLTKSKFYTPHRTYSHKTSFPQKMHINKYLPCVLDDSNNLQVFYNSAVFNSFLTIEEEEVYKLFSKDNKTTITKTKIEPNTLYTFKVIEETNSLRICEIFKYDINWVGKHTTGKIKHQKKKNEIITPIGKGECVLQNNKHNKQVSAILWKIKDDKMFFVEIDNPVKDAIEVTVDTVRENFLMVSNENIKGIVFTNEINEYDDIKRKKKTIKVYVKEELLGFYIFEILSAININDYIEAKVVKKLDNKYTLEYQTYSGFINTTNMDQFMSNNNKAMTIKGRIINIKDGEFELSQVQNISVPFDAVVSESEEIEEDEELECSGTLMDLLASIKRYTEDKKYKEVRELYYKHINTLNSTDKDNLSLVYCNFLQYTTSDTTDLIKEMKKVVGHCSDKFLDKVGSVSDNFEVIEFCYKKKLSRELYTKYIDMCYKLGKKITDYNYMDVAVDYIYKYEDTPRIKTEKIIGNIKPGWIKYIENETQDYKRILFRRVVNMDWKVGDMKEWYRMWMQYEKENNGNVDEVRTRAKEFVESIKNKQ
ncbi:ribosome biogenesis factor RRP5 [Vairimorpha necatrix]|uniref:Ribosome biogenesis factor RRP5 n=1 Tax=Vairimorpha necatrix TaxID=6039 RepID=A0AAX4J812_9MICR